MRTVIFDAGIYPREAIEEAIISYASISKIKLIEKDSQFICNISDTEYELDETCHEFDNYVLQLTIGMGGKKA